MCYQENKTTRRDTHLRSPPLTCVRGTNDHLESDMQHAIVVLAGDKEMIRDAEGDENVMRLWDFTGKAG